MPPWMRRWPVRVAARRSARPLPHASVGSKPSEATTMRFENDEREWLEPDGWAGSPSGTVSGVRTRRYHGLLLTATTPPTGRMVLVNGFDAWATTPRGRVALSSQRYAPGVQSPRRRVPHRGVHGRSVADVDVPPWRRPHVRQEIFVPHGEAADVVTWTPRWARGPVTARRAPVSVGARLPRPAPRERRVPASSRAERRRHARVAALRRRAGGALSRRHGTFHGAPDWYRQFLYTAERERGLDDTEDLASPG